MALRRQSFGTEVASCEFRLRFRNRRKKRVRARVGKPYRISPREWACPVEIRGFEGRYPDIRGVDSMQALCLATALIRSRFEDFFSKGGTVLDVDDDSEWDLPSVMATFGAKDQGAPHNKPLQRTGLAPRR
jgi:Domain of unknown function (DUF6968)